MSVRARVRSHALGVRTDYRPRRHTHSAWYSPGPGESSGARSTAVRPPMVKAGPSGPRTWLLYWPGPGDTSRSACVHKHQWSGVNTDGRDHSIHAWLVMRWPGPGGTRRGPPARVAVGLNAAVGCTSRSGQARRCVRGRAHRHTRPLLGCWQPSMHPQHAASSPVAAHLHCRSVGDGVRGALAPGHWQVIVAGGGQLAAGELGVGPVMHGYVMHGSGHTTRTRTSPHARTRTHAGPQRRALTTVL